MIPPRSPVQAILDANQKWSDAVDNAEPGFFRKCAEGQWPKVLWFGCADSRVPESVLAGARPGEIFVHRNIANQFHPDDDSALAVLTYSIHVVGVEHVVFAGHTHCGGAVACYNATRPLAEGDTPAKECALVYPPAPTSLSRWLTPLTSLVNSLDLSDKPPAEAIDAIVEENVKRGVENLCKADPIVQAWKAGKQVWVHGWVYDVGSGKIKDLAVSRAPGGALVN